MNIERTTQYSFGYFIRELVFDVVRFPVWWYSGGLGNVAKAWRRGIGAAADRLSLGIWFRNMFRPMYGDTSRSGRIISFFLRLIVLAWRLVELFVWSLALSLLLVIWVAIPPALVYAISQQFR